MSHPGHKVCVIARSSTVQLLTIHTSMDPTKDSPISNLETITDAATPTPDGAAHRVFSIPELLCDIVARFSLEEIIVATGVCHTWRNAIAADLSIQQALFLNPREVREVIAEDFYILDLERPIPFENCTIIGELNPWISDICGCVYGCSSVHTSVNFEFLSCGGLWREMFVTQPPCKAAVVSMQSLDSMNALKSLDFEREAGIKMGELYDFIAEETRYRPECRRTVVYLKNFDTEEYAYGGHFPTTRCQVRNGEVCRPEQLPERPCSGSECSDDFEPGDGDEGPYGVLSYEDYDLNDDDEISDDYDDPDEFAAEQADEADQYVRW